MYHWYISYNHSSKKWFNQQTKLFIPSGEKVMLTKQIEIDNPYPEWADTSGLELWEPDRLYAEWMTLLYSLWHRIDYV